MSGKKLEKAGKKKSICKIACALSIVLSAGILLILWYVLKDREEY
ncbi:MAG: hypothetical protein Q4C25_07675 [Bacillota bacterium]|nr:hypothetical protein [Bacillota bacterium]